MTSEEILQKAIEKAEKNGLKLYFSHRELYQKVIQKEAPLWTAHALIFSLPFAKAMWGDELVHPGIETWKHHLQQMVLEKEPLKYLEQYL